MRTLAFLLAFAALTACRTGTTQKIDPTADAGCGDGNITAELGEQCEGSNLKGETCQSQGFDTGTLVCGSDCRFATTSCVKRCGNGVIDPGEECDSDAGFTACTTFGYRRCDSTACTVNSKNCVSLLYEPGVPLSQVKGGRAVIGDLPPKGLGDLVMVVPSFARVELFPYVVNQGLSPSRKLSFLRSPVDVAVVDFDQDGVDDVATVNEDGSVDGFRQVGGAYELLRFADAGCPAKRFVGTAGGKLFSEACATDAGFGAVVVNGTGATRTLLLPGSTAAAVGGGDLYVIDGLNALTTLTAASNFDAGTLAALPTALSSLATADFDGDGDRDLVGSSTSGIVLYENTGTGFAEKAALASAPGALVTAADLDLDGRPDVLWAANGKIEVRRNQGTFPFTTTTLTLPAGTVISLAPGDLDGDGDLDLAITLSTSGDETVTSIFLNKVR